MKKRIWITLFAVALPAGVGAQSPNPLELGVDGGVTIGLGDNSVTKIDLPVQSFRVGFPLGRRTSLEPKLGISIVTGGGDTFTSYRGELGLLYHLGSSRYPGAYHRAGMYVRPFVGISGFSNGFDSSTGLIGGGVGIKMPIVSRLSSRFEANLAGRFGDDDGAELGLLAGLSFFTR